ncbi:hypothetical protein D3C84_499020 [compost metagenome]
MQILHALKGDRTTTLQGQVITAVEFRHLIALISPTDQGQIAACSDFAADVGHLGDFIPAGFLLAEAAFFLFVVEGVITVLRGQQLEVVTCHQIGFVACGNTTGDHSQVIART